MPKQVWERLGLPICSDHTMTMSSTNTSTDATLGVLENLPLNFGQVKFVFKYKSWLGPTLISYLGDLSIVL